METLIISIVALFAIIIVGGLLVGPPRRRRNEAMLEPSHRGSGSLKERDRTAEVDDEAVLEDQPWQPETLVRPRYRDRLGKARSVFGEYLGAIRGRGGITSETWDDLEEAMIRADVGVSTSTTLLEGLRDRVKAENITTPDALIEALKDGIKKSLASADRDLRIDPDVTNVWLFVGVNGVGKTTTIGKVAMRYAQDNHSVVMAAGDTFRAAAAEQLTVWAGRAGADIVRGQENGDPGAVIFDAIERAHARRSDLVLADTAGRLHTKTNLMEELKKIKRICEREPARLQEILLVLDATTGQNGLNQARQFADAVACTGVVLTKLDGSSKGGIALAIENDLHLPVKLVGLGETASDLIDFDPEEFVDALFE